MTQNPRPTSQDANEAIPAPFEPVGDLPEKGEPQEGADVLEASFEELADSHEAAADDSPDDVVDALVEPAKPGEADAAEADDGEVVDALVEPVEDTEGLPGKEPAAAPKKGKHARRRKLSVKRVLGVLLALLVVAALVAAGLYTWQRWYRFDDASDIQGVWQVQETGETVVFDAHELKLTKSISYPYQINPQEKAITYQFTSYEGGGRYYLSEDRQLLVILEGGGELGFWAELGYLPEDVVSGQRKEDGLILFKRLSDDTNAEPSSSKNGLGNAGASSSERPYIGSIGASSSSSASESSSSSSSERQRNGQDQRAQRDQNLPEGLHRAEDGLLYDENGVYVEEDEYGALLNWDWEQHKAIDAEAAQAQAQVEDGQPYGEADYE